MPTFSDYKPKSGLRQPRIIYKVDDPSMAPLEDLRRLGGMRNMNEIYLEALLIGAPVVLARLHDKMGNSLDLSTPATSPTAFAPPESSTSPTTPPLVENAVFQSPAPAAGEPGPALTVPPMPEPRITRVGTPDSSAAMNRFNRFGKL